MVSDECRFKASGVEALVDSLEGITDSGGMVDRSRNYPDWGLLETWAFNVRFNTEMQQEFHPEIKKWLDFAKELEQKVKDAKPTGDFQYYTHEGLSFLGKDMENELGKMLAVVKDHWLDLLIKCECGQQ